MKHLNFYHHQNGEKKNVDSTTQKCYDHSGIIKKKTTVDSKDSQGTFEVLKQQLVSLTPINYAKINYPQLFENVKL